MSVVAELAVNVVAQVGKALTGLGQLRKSLDVLGSASGKVTGALSGVGGALTGITVGLSAGALASSLKKRIDDIDAMSDAATRLNATYNGLQSLEYAAKLTGTEFGALESSLGKLQKNLGEVAATGKGKAAEALRDLGLSAKELVNLKTDEAFSFVAESLSKVGNEAEQARLAVALFGKSGQSIINTVNLGAAGIAEMREEMERLGLGIEQEQVDKLANFNDQLDRLGVAWAGVKTMIVITVAPGVAEVLEGLVGGKSLNTKEGMSVNTQPNQPWTRKLAFGWLVDKFDRQGVYSESPDAIKADQMRRGVFNPFNSAGAGGNQLGIANDEANQRGMKAVGEMLGNAFTDKIWNESNKKNIADLGRAGLGGLVSARKAAQQFYVNGAMGNYMPTTKNADQKAISVGMNRAVSASSQEGAYALNANKRMESDIERVADNSDQMVEFLSALKTNSEEWAKDPMFAIDGAT